MRERACVWVCVCVCLGGKGGGCVEGAWYETLTEMAWYFWVCHNPLPSFSQRDSHKGPALLWARVNVCHHPQRFTRRLVCRAALPTRTATQLPQLGWNCKDPLHHLHRKGNTCTLLSFSSRTGNSISLLHSLWFHILHTVGKDQVLKIKVPNWILCSDETEEPLLVPSKVFHWMVLLGKPMCEMWTTFLWFNKPLYSLSVLYLL